MMNDLEATMSASPMCGMEIEERVDQAWIAKDCPHRAGWVVRVKVSITGEFSEPVFRCWEHLHGTVDFNLDAHTTTAVLVERVVVTIPIEVRT